MPPKAQLKQEPPLARDWPAYWLVYLERSVAAGDYRAAANAQAQLRLLGLEVVVRTIPTREVAGAQ